MMRSFCFSMNDASSINCHRLSGDLTGSGASENAGEESERFGFGCLAGPVERELPLIVFDHDAFVTAVAIKQIDSSTRQDMTFFNWPCDRTVRLFILYILRSLLRPKPRLVGWSRNRSVK